MTNIMTLCASHIEETKRIALLDTMIQSHMNQTLANPLYISISFAPLFARDVADLVARRQCGRVRFFVHTEGRMSQFEHYRFLVSQIDPIFHNRTWCLFADDDDFMHPDRARVFSRMIAKLPRTSTSVRDMRILLSSWKHDEQVTVKSLVDKIMDANSDSYIVTYSNEYVNYCVRLSFLRRFCDFLRAQNKLHTRQCDIILGLVLFHTYDQASRFTNDQWLYAYNQSTCHSRVCDKTGVRYYNATYDGPFFDALAREFSFDWLPNFEKGDPLVYSRRAD